MRSLLMRVQLGHASAGSLVEHRLPICLSCKVGGQPPPYIPHSALYVRERLRVAAPMNEGIKGLGDAAKRVCSDSKAPAAPVRKKLATVVENALLGSNRDQLSCLAVSWWRRPKET